MTQEERSVASLAFTLAAIALVAASFAFPWFAYHYSSGRQTAEGGFHDANETGVVTHRYEAGPAAQSGDVRPADAAAAQRLLDASAWALGAAVLLLAVAALAEAPRAAARLRRPTVLAAQAIAFLAVAAALLVAWFALPATMGRGVGGPFTSHLAEDGYTHTTLALGWVLAALALPFAFGAFLAKFQAGGLDPTTDADLLEAVR